MIYILYSEFYKLVHNGLVKMSLICGFFLGIIINLSYKNNAWNNQVEIMSIFFPLLLCVLVGCIWANEYSDKTLNYILINEQKKEKIFIGKIISSLLMDCFLFIAYVLGLILSNPTIFLNSKHIENMYIIPFCLIWVYTEMLILVAILCKSFSKTAMAAVLIILFNIFFYKLSIVYGNCILIKIFGEYTYYGIYIVTSEGIKETLLLFRCLINFIIGIVTILLAFISFAKTNF